MLDTLFAFFYKFKYIFIFYAIIIVFLALKRKKLIVQAKIIFLYRMKWGLKWMDKYSQKFREWIILLGYIGVGAGYVGLVFISVLLIKNLVDMIIKPAMVSGVSLVLPGINIPGLGVLPFWYWLLAIFIIAIVHEFGHGIVARAHNIKVKNTGIVFFGPIIGAFVEPDEGKLRKEKDIKQYSVLAAGSFSNILLAIFALILLNFAFMPLQQTMVEPIGFSFDAYYTGNFPAEMSGLSPNTIIMGVNGNSITGFEKVSEMLYCARPGDEMSFMTEKENYDLVLAEDPEISGKSFLGIQSIHNEFKVKEKYKEGVWMIVYSVVIWISGFLRWLFILSLGIGLFNLLPLPIVDGGRMAQVFLHKLKGPEKGEKRYRQVSLFFLLILLLNLFYPLLVKLFI